MERRRHLEKQIGKAARLGSALAPVPTPERYLQLLEAQAARKQQALDAQRCDTRTEVEIPGYAEGVQSAVGSRQSADREQPSAPDFPETGSVPYTMEKLDRRNGSRLSTVDSSTSSERVFTSRAEFDRWQESQK